MPWLSRINDREARRLARRLEHGVVDTSRQARAYAGQFAHRAGAIAGRATDHAGQAAQHLADYGRHEGAMLARIAAKQAVRAGRAIKADPAPAIVGAIGLALLANLVFGRRNRTATRS